MSFDNVPRCQHVKMNGTQCGCPALRRRRLCFFHVRCQDQRKRIASDQFKQARFVMPILEDANAVQMALMQIMQLLGSGQMEHKTAALMLYALQTASCNLRNTRFEASEVTDVVIDRDDVHRTSIGGPQWFEEDFEEEEGEAEEDAPEKNGAEAAAAQPTAAKSATEPEAATPEATAPTVNSKMTMDEAREKVRRLIHNWILDSVEGKARQELNQNQSGKISSTKPGTQ
jgi:hypothetical protein